MAILVVGEDNGQQYSYRVLSNSRSVYQGDSQRTFESSRVINAQDDSEPQWSYSNSERFTATHYCRSYTECPYRGNTVSCGTVYAPEDESIAAVGYSRLTEWPCGTVLTLCPRMENNNTKQPQYGELFTLSCISVVRADTCPACGQFTIDLSEAAFELVCGELSKGVCEVTVEVGK